jgi:hypothetical protein
MSHGVLETNRPSRNVMCNVKKLGLEEMRKM